METRLLDNSYRRADVDFGGSHSDNSESQRRGDDKKSVIKGNQKLRETKR